MQNLVNGVIAEVKKTKLAKLTEVAVHAFIDFVDPRRLWGLVDFGLLRSMLQCCLNDDAMNDHRIFRSRTSYPLRRPVFCTAAYCAAQENCPETLLLLHGLRANLDKPNTVEGGGTVGGGFVGP